MPPGTARTPSTPCPGHTVHGLCPAWARCAVVPGPPTPPQGPWKAGMGEGGTVNPHLVRAPVPGGHDGQAEGHPSPREVPGVGVSEHVHGICPGHMAGGIGDGPGWDGLGVGLCQLLVPANLLKSCRGGWDGDGQRPVAMTPGPTALISRVTPWYRRLQLFCIHLSQCLERCGDRAFFKKSEFKRLFYLYLK